MSIAFLNPLFLFALAAGILPILIHRLTKRKSITVKFSAVRLLLQSQRGMTRPQRLKHLLLLALRILAVVGLVLIMARPALVRENVLAMSDRGVKAVILDNSLSMGYREERGERYELAQKAAKEVIEGFDGQVVVIPTAPVLGSASGEREIRWMGRQEALKEVAAIPLSFGRGDPQTALGLAYRALKDRKGPKEILFINDMARGDWEGFDMGKIGVVSAEAGITFLRIGGASRDANFAVKGVRLAEGESVVGVPARLEVRVANFSDQPGSPFVQLYLSGVKADQKKLELRPGEEGKAFFELFLEKPGWVDGEIRLSGDPLPLDDRFYFPLRVRDKVKVLVVDGDPRTSLKASESYYLLNALNPGGTDGSPFLATVITEQQLADLDLQPYAAIFLLNVAQAQASRLASFLDSGKPIFLFLGDRVIPEAYNRLPFFPWRLAEVREPTAQPERIAQIDYNHKALRPFSGTGGESLKRASFWRYFKIEGAKGSLIALQNKDRLFVQAEMGRGKLLLFASSADLDWNDLSLKAAYLPLIQGLLKEAVGLSQENMVPGGTFGEKASSTQFTHPQERPGIYKFSSPSGEMRRAVNPPLEESDLRKISAEEMKKKLGTIELRMVEYKEGTLSAAHAGRKELWPFLLTFLFIILAFEMGVASRI